MSPLEVGEAATELLKAVIRGTGYPASVPDTEEYRQLFADLEDDVGSMQLQNIAPEIPYDYTEPPDPEPIAPAAPPEPAIEQYANADSILGQLDLAGGLVGQLLDLSVGNEAWRREKRDAHGQWTRGSAGGAVAKRMATAQLMNPGMSRITMRQVQANRQAAQHAVAARLAEEHARRALDEAKSEVERVTRELQEQARTEEQRKHRVKLAVHAVLVIGGAVLAAIMAHYDISPVVAAFAGAMPLLGMELTDWKKKL